MGRRKTARGSKDAVSTWRNFLKGVGAAAIAAAVPTVAGAMPRPRPDATASGKPLSIKRRPEEALDKRMRAATRDLKAGLANHQNNGDELLYPNGIANFTKGFLHNSFGEVDATVYAAYQAAVKTGLASDFDNLTMGGTVPLVDPQAGLAFDLEGVDASQNTIPLFPALASAALAAQAVEVYWLALARDVPFLNYATDPTAIAAATELSGLASFTGPRDNSGNVTAQTLFRGFTAGDVIGPYVSQFLIQPFNYGVIPFNGYMTDLTIGLGGSDYMTDAASWLKVENGQQPFAAEHPDSQLRYPRSGRDLAAYVHIDVLYQEYLNAALMLMQMHAPLNSGNPYNSLKSETGFITFGLPQVEALVGEVTTRALKNAWFQKWFVHRALRPEAYGGLVHFY